MSYLEIEVQNEGHHQSETDNHWSNHVIEVLSTSLHNHVSSNSVHDGTPNARKDSNSQVYESKNLSNSVLASCIVQ